MKDSETLSFDLNPILDEVIPTFTGEITAAVTLCKVPGAKFKVRQPRCRCLCGLGLKALDSQPILCTCIISTQDFYGKNTHTAFDLTNDWSSQTNSLHLHKYSS